jgi:hypothetical protein
MSSNWTKDGVRHIKRLSSSSWYKDGGQVRRNIIRRPHMIGTFSPTDSALLLIDHQIGTMKLIKNIPLDVVKRNTLALAKTAKILGVLVVLTSSQEQNVQGPLLPELEGVLPEAFAARIAGPASSTPGTTRTSRKP